MSKISKELANKKSIKKQFSTYIKMNAINFSPASMKDFNLSSFQNAYGSCSNILRISSSVGDPDPYVFGPPRPASGSNSHKYGSGSGSFHHQAKRVRVFGT
jgi:hypothetical protein